MCTCCSDLPVVRQPILIYPFIPIDYNFKAPLNWNPKIMPNVNFQVGLSALGIQPKVSMNINMGPPNPPNMNINLNGPSMSSHSNPMGLSIKVPPPQVEMSVRSPPTTMHMHGNLGGMQVNQNFSGGVGISGSVSSPNSSLGGGIGVGVNLRPF